MPLDEDFRYLHAEEEFKSYDDSDYPIRRIPTGVPDFDEIIRGGIPSGSVILLLGEDGAGGHEFAYTTAYKIEFARKHPTLRTSFLGTKHYDVLPERVCYITFSRSKNEVVREVGTTFNIDYYTMFRDEVIFKDFSGRYFKDTIVPSSWTESDGQDLSSILPEKGNGLLGELVGFLDENAKSSLVIIDSLTDLVESNSVNIMDLVSTLKGMRRAAKSWEGVVYLLLSQGIMEKREQQMLLDAVDGVFIFEWSRYLQSSKRQRYMYVEKFSTVLSHIERKRIAKFPLMINSKNGLIVMNLDFV